MFYIKFTCCYNFRLLWSFIYNIIRWKLFLTLSERRNMYFPVGQPCYVHNILLFHFSFLVHKEFVQSLEDVAARPLDLVQRAAALMFWMDFYHSCIRYCRHQWQPEVDKIFHRLVGFIHTKNLFLLFDTESNTIMMTTNPKIIF